MATSAARRRRRRGAHLMRSSSIGKLAFLNDVVGVFEAGIEAHIIHRFYPVRVNAYICITA